VGSHEAQTATEHVLVAIWSQVLGTRDIDRCQDFFRSGGDSLLAAKVVLLVRAALKTPITVRMLLDHPVLADFADQIDRLRSDRDTPGARG
jgi:hypothetical protein